MAGLLFSTVFTSVIVPVVHLGLVCAVLRIGWNTIPPLVAAEAGSGAADA